MFNLLVVWVSCNVVCFTFSLADVLDQCVIIIVYVSFVPRANCLIFVSIVSRLSISCNCIILVYLSTPVILCTARPGAWFCVPRLGRRTVFVIVLVIL